MNQSVSVNLTDELNTQKKSMQTSSIFKKWQRWLSAALVVQVLLAMGIYAYQKNGQQSSSVQPLLSFDKNNIDKITISDNTTTVTLQESGGDWLLPDLQQLPVEQSRLDDLFEKLDSTKLTWPVASTTSSHERFEVADNKFQRRVSLYNGDEKLGDVFLGSSPGFKKIHLRREGDAEVYAVALSQFDFLASANDWLNKSLIDVKTVDAVTAADYQLQKTGDQWSLAGDESAKLNTAIVEQVTNAFTNIQIVEVASDTPQGDAKTYTVKADGNTWEYTFIKSADSHYVKRNDKDVFFKISQSDYDKVININKSQLVLPPEPAAQPSPETSVPEVKDGKK